MKINSKIFANLLRLSTVLSRKKKIGKNLEIQKKKFGKKFQNKIFITEIYKKH